MSLRVLVDYDLCESNGLCVDSAPDVFDLRDDDNLYLLVEPVPAPREAAVRQAAKRCPRQAIRLEQA